MRQWLPELARMPSEWIHHPWDAPPSVLRSAGVELGLNYPVPIVDIDLARERLTARCQLSSLIFVACMFKCATTVLAYLMFFPNGSCFHGVKY